MGAGLDCSRKGTTNSVGWTGRWTAAGGANGEVGEKVGKGRNS